MTDLEVIKKRRRTVRNIDGKVVKEEHYYVLGRKSLFFHRYLILRPKKRVNLFVRDILESEEVEFEWALFPSMATTFDSEGDAIRVLFDITQRPDNYIHRSRSYGSGPR